MPIYMDRHDDVTGTPEEVAEAHRLDAEVEARFGVHYHTYWFDPSRRTVFCLAEGPDREAVEAVHRASHGQMPTAVLELPDGVPLNAFLGEPPSHPLGTPYTAPAVRAIFFTDVCGSVAQTHALGDEGHLALLREHNAIVREALTAHGGNEVKHTGDGIMASFASVASAVQCAIAVQHTLRARNAMSPTPLQVSIGISAGEPLSDGSDDLFGAAVQLAARLCDAARPGDILVSLAVRELCVGKPFRFEDGGQLALKGLPEPTPAYAVAWTT